MLMSKAVHYGWRVFAPCYLVKEYVSLLKEFDKITVPVKALEPTFAFLLLTKLFAW